MVTKQWDSFASLFSSLLDGDWLTYFKPKLCYDRRRVSQSVLLLSTHLGPKARFLLLLNICRVSSSAQSFSGPSPAGIMAIFYCLKFETPRPKWRGPRIYIRQEQGGPLIAPFSSPAITRRATVEVFDPTSIRGTLSHWLTTKSIVLFVDFI
jgi:hypothetical protein